MARRVLLSVAACVLGVAAAPPAAPVFNVRSFGAKGDGTTLDTPAFQAAVAALADAAGGVLYVPPGTYLISPFNLTSNMELRLDAAKLQAPANFSYWHVIAPLPSYGRGRNYDGPRYDSLIHGFNVSNVRITSNSSVPGVIDGGGAPWWYAVRHKTLNVTPGHTIEFLWSDHIELDRITVQNSPFWSVHLWSSQYIWAHDLSVINPRDSPNTDGIDPDSSSHVLIERFNASTGDDCVAIKAGWAPWATWHRGVRSGYSVPTENITVREMTCATPSGCIAIGSEMSGGVENVTATNITCITAGWGLNVKSALGRGGYIRNVTFQYVIFGPGKIPTAFEAGDTYVDTVPPAPVNATLVPIIDGIFITNVTYVGPSNSIKRPGDFEGLGGEGAYVCACALCVCFAFDVQSVSMLWTCSQRVIPPCL